MRAYFAVLHVHFFTKLLEIFINFSILNVAVF